MALGIAEDIQVGNGIDPSACALLLAWIIPVIT